MSNLPVLSKLLERAVCKQLQSHLDAAELMPTTQSAYIKGHSTETSLAKVCSDIITAMDEGHHVLLALLELSAAFYTVDHKILLQRLSKSFSVRDGVLNWLRSYLGRLKMREWKKRYGQNCKGGKCRSGKSGSRSQGWKMQE